MFEPGRVKPIHTPKSVSDCTPMSWDDKHGDDQRWTFTVLINGKEFTLTAGHYRLAFEAKQAMRDFVDHMNEKV